MSIATTLSTFYTKNTCSCSERRVFNPGECKKSNIIKYRLVHILNLMHMQRVSCFCEKDCVPLPLLPGLQNCIANHPRCVRVSSHIFAAVPRNVHTSNVHSCALSWSDTIVLSTWLTRCGISKRSCLRNRRRRHVCSQNAIGPIRRLNTSPFPKRFEN